MAVDSAVCHWVSLALEDESNIHEVLGMWLVHCMGLFYSADLVIGYRDPKWFQGGTNVLVELFRRVGLMANVSKSNTMTFHPGAICTGVSDKAFSCRSKGEGVT